jgi:hypothetical protein
VNINLIFLIFTDNEESSNIAAFLSLPFLIASSIFRGKKSNNHWKASQLEVRDGFITHVKSNAEVQETITRRREKFIGLGYTLQPFIIIVGPTLNNILNYFVVIDDTFYQLNSIIDSVDCCFKTIITFNAEYPVECKVIWHFIQKGLFKLETPFDNNFTAVNAFNSDIGISM